MKTQMLALNALAPALLCSAAFAQTVVEYVNQSDFPRSPNGQYFYTADPGEQAYVDTGAAGAFKRTGAIFPLGGPNVVCRFYGSVSPGPNSHFYTVLPDECAALKAAQKTPKPSAEQQWNYEGSPLNATKPITGADGKNECPAGTTAIYRAYNAAFSNGVKNVWDSNHRYSARLADIQVLVNLGWKDEGISICVPTGATQASEPVSTGVARQCVSPRAETRFADKAGTADTEKSWVRAFVNERYLWTDNSPRVALDESATTTGYFAKKLSPFNSALGNKQDRFSAQQLTSDFEATQSGLVGGYGLNFSAIRTSPPRSFVVRYVEIGSPAALAGISRGMKVLEVNGNDFVNGGNTTALNTGLFTPALGSANTFAFEDPAGARINVTLIAGSIARDAANEVKILNTPQGKVGYLHYTTFNTAPSESQLINAMAQFQQAGVKELVLDLRYNGGGLISISSQMGYMIAGAQNTANKTYYQFTYNNKRQAETNAPSSIWPFYSTASGRTGSGTTAGAALPTLNLKRVFVLTGTGTASASEGVINGLRGIDVETILVGARTTGKPYGSLPTDNCGITYSMLEFQGNNAKGFAEFGDGFAPTCTVDDDLTKLLGDPSEKRLATALSYLSTGQCPAGTRESEALKIAREVIDAPQAGPAHDLGGAHALPAGEARALLAQEKRARQQ